MNDRNELPSASEITTMKLALPEGLTHCAVTLALLFGDNKRLRGFVALPLATATSRRR